ncbi:hypothetical protein NX059_001344 [Plenodomus lindquistii]|nr:hypothetical protein NX059_001344 [Plenodomus lindquistii]
MSSDLTHTDDADHTAPLSPTAPNHDNDNDNDNDNHYHDHDHDHDNTHDNTHDHTHDNNAYSFLPGHDRSFLHDLLADSPRPFAAAHLDDLHSLTPPSANFFDSILNPAGLDHGRYSPFAYRPSPPVRGRSSVYDMTPRTRATEHDSQRPGRLSNGYVDLTSMPDSPTSRRKRESSSPGPSAKRAKRHDGRAAKPESGEAAKIEEIDLTDETTPAQQFLQKQRLEAVKAQEKPEETTTTFNTFTCVICMDNPTDLSATACGHLFCHTCLMEALIAGENRTGPGEAKRSQCPVCRKVLSRTKSTDIIPLLLMKGLSTQPRKKVTVATSAAAAKV